MNIRHIFLIFIERGIRLKLSPRQEEIISLVKEHQPITSESLAERLGVTRAALRADLAVLTMIGTLDARPKVGYVYLGKSSSGLVYQHISKIKVSEIMSKPITVSEDTMVYDAIVYLFLNDVGTLFIENNGVLTGAVSRKDFLKISIGGTDIHKVPVGVIMTRMPNIICANENDNAYDLAKKIIEHEIDSIPVVEIINNTDGKDQMKIIGKVSKTNITKLFVKLGKNED
ncbi:transcriptional repressor CcpN [Clostridium saccharobutylicum]|nr:transcriptional repressor CcpN [Clostridium saccharobutylicum]OOM18306.1 transcriptional repressor CcpN [Clostridium saccharobutylicum]